jgi:hypothetical protein
MGLALGTIALWLLAGVAEQLAQGPDAYVVALNVKQAAIALTPPAILLFVVYYTERFTFSRRQLALLFALPLCTVALVWTTPWHEWVWPHRRSGRRQQRTMRLAWGPGTSGCTSPSATR